MQWIAKALKWIMLVSGVLTCTMLYAAIDPQGALRQTFGTTLEGPLADIVVRNWGVLITLVGALLIYGAYRPASRPLVLTVAIVSKMAFIGLVLAYARRIWARRAWPLALTWWWWVCSSWPWCRCASRSYSAKYASNRPLTRIEYAQ